jgi:hypothetical protein
MSTVISIQLDRVEALAAELASLAGELSGETALCTSAAASLLTALGGDEGWHAAVAGHAWGGLLGLADERTAAVGATLSAAVRSYREADAQLAQFMPAGSPRPAAGPR